MNISVPHPGVGLAGAVAALAGVPALAGYTAALPVHGPAGLPARWWAGSGAHPPRLTAMSAAVALLAPSLVPASARHRRGRK